MYGFGTISESLRYKRNRIWNNEQGIRNVEVKCCINFTIPYSLFIILYSL
jgi:hypothetical protein